MSPIVAIDRITRPEHLVEYLAQLIGSSDLPFRSVVKYNERLLREYPACMIMGGPLSKEIHGTHTFAVTLRADIYVFHAKLTEERQTRTYNDMVLASNLVALLESNMQLGGRIIVGWVDSEIPGVSPPRSNRHEGVISTRMSYQATQETRF